MKKLLSLALISGLLFACNTKKDDPTPAPPTVTASGKITYKADGKEISHDGRGYILDNEFSFLKWDSPNEQLSMDFYGIDAGTYVVTNAAKKKGNAKIYYYPDLSGTPKVSWVSKTGTFIVSSYSKTGGYKISGTFTATLEKVNDGVATGDKMEITDGVFTDIVLMDTR